jgi:hypothetical protein
VENFVDKSAFVWKNITLKKIKTECGKVIFSDFIDIGSLQDMWKNTAILGSSMYPKTC